MKEEILKAQIKKLQKELDDQRQEKTATEEYARSMGGVAVCFSTESAKEEILKAQIEQIQQAIVVEKQKEFTGLDQEKTAAEEYLIRFLIRLGVNVGKGVVLADAVKRAHEAGQAHATAATHEIYAELLSCAQFISEMCIYPGGHKSEIMEQMRKILKNLNQQAKRRKTGDCGSNYARK